MTPPRRDLDTLRDDDKTPTKLRNPAEDSLVSEIEHMLTRHGERRDVALTNLLERLEKVEARADEVEVKASETHVALLRAVPKRWRWAVVLAGLLGTGGVASAGTAWSALQSYRADVAEEAVAEREAKELEGAVRTHIASPHVDPNAAADLAIALDGLAKRLDAIDRRLERLEERRGR